MLAVLAVLAVAVTLGLASATAFAQQQPASAGDPPGRVGALGDVAGSVVYAAPGQSDWSEALRNRPLTRGDRLWTDEGARAEVHFGASALHMDSRSFVELVAVDSETVQLQLNEGTVNARVRELQAGEEFEIDTPNLALRAAQQGDWRIDVDPQRGFTRVAVRSGTALVYGAGGGALQLLAGEVMIFAGRDLAQGPSAPAAGNEAFEHWVDARNRAEDRSIAARYVPRELVGYQELDRHGTWSQDPRYGPVWFPNIATADWAPYRYGHWESIAPWGWTWIDDAPWGFAPFHYGRWAMVGARWAWVPGPIGASAVYAPALVQFLDAGPGIAWYPLGPGEVWRPYFSASPRYVRAVNRDLVADSRDYNTGTPYFMRRPGAVTAMRIEDFERGRAVQRAWSRVSPQELAAARPVMPPGSAREARRDAQAQEVVRAPQAPVQRQRFAQPIAPATPRSIPYATPYATPYWGQGEEGGYPSRQR